MISEETVNGWYHLGRLYYLGEDGKEENDAEALKWLNKAAFAGHVSAQYYLGEIYDHGNGVEMDLKAAAFWYAKAALNGDKDGKKGLRKLKWYIDIKPWKKLAEMEGLADGEESQTANEWFTLGYNYYKGKGVEQDYELAVACYSRAAWQGHIVAANNLGLCYELGNGVVHNVEAMIYWYEKSANAGYATAQSNLGLLYYYGNKVEKDYEKALYWYKKAESQGYGRTMYELGVVYGQGLAVKKNYATAKKYFLKAQEKGYEKAQSGLDWVAKLEWEEKKNQAKTIRQNAEKPRANSTLKNAGNAYTNPHAKAEEESRLKKMREQEERQRRQNIFKRFTLDLKKAMGWGYSSNYGERLRDFNYSFSVGVLSEEFKVSVRAKVELLEQYFRDSSQKSVREYLIKYVQNEVYAQMQKAGFSQPFSVELSIEFIAY